MKNLLSILGFLIITISMSCTKEICETCTRCISYDQELVIINEVRRCDVDTLFISEFQRGFVDGAMSQNRNSICFNLGIVCREE